MAKNVIFYFRDKNLISVIKIKINKFMKKKRFQQKTFLETEKKHS